MPTVLVIEDDDDMRELERTALETSGYQVVVATNGAEGLQRLRTCKPCVIVLDVMMPVMDGLTFLAERQTYGRAASVPVVCVSAGGDELMAEASRLGARECLAKPTDFDELCDIVGRYCRSG